MLCPDILTLHQIRYVVGPQRALVCGPSQSAFAPGNAVILKGGKEAAHSNTVLVETIREALRSVDGVPEDCVQLISSREDVASLLSMGMSHSADSFPHLGRGKRAYAGTHSFTTDAYVDLIIPRGSNSLVKYVQVWQ